jgi:hypothetical protein
MRRTVCTLLVVAAVAVFAFAAGGALANKGGVPAIPLNPGQETGEVDSDGHGFFTYTITGTTLCYTIEVSDLTGPPVAAHIHEAPRNVAGGVEITLVHPTSATGTSSGCVSEGQGDAAVGEITAIAANPRGYYVNVHTMAYPGGEVRGQLK